MLHRIFSQFCEHQWMVITSAWNLGWRKSKLGIMLMANAFCWKKHPASFCPNDNLQFEHIHNLTNWHSLTCLSNFIGTDLQQWGKKITLDELLMCSAFFTTVLAYSLSSFNTDKCPQTYIAHRVCVSTEPYRSHLSAVVSPSNLQTHLKSLRYQQFQLKRH